jgi:cyclophilin family peptidyl-prolyl cis-trans isomerase
MIPRRPPALALALALVLLPTALSGTALAQDQAPAPLGPPDVQPLTDPPSEPSGDGTGVRLSTDLGDVVIGLFTESAPVASQNFVNLVEAGFYDGVGFHRLVPGFVIQGGDPAGDGTGGPGYTIADEPVVGRYGRGIVAMARTDAPDSQGSQFFVVLDDAAEAALESKRTYTIFGRVVEGMDVVDAIAATPNGGAPENRAVDPVIIRSATIEQVQLPPEPEREPLVMPGSADPELEARIPAAVGGLPLDPRSFSGSEVVAGSAPDDPIQGLTTVLESLGLDLDDLSLASASAGDGETFAGVIAVAIDGVAAADFEAQVSPALLGYGDGVEVTEQEVAGRQVKRIGPGTGLLGDMVAWVVTGSDVVWYVVTGSDALRDEVIGALE